MIRIKNCCHSTKHETRFDADVGDHVLIHRGNGVYLGGIIHSIPSSNGVTVELIQGGQITVTAAEISALPIED
jgi:hypothetical protein